MRSFAASIVAGAFCLPRNCVVQFETTLLSMPFGAWVTTIMPRLSTAAGVNGQVAKGGA